MGDQEFNLKFVREVEKHEELYNYKLPGYSRKDVTEKAWQQIAGQVNLSAAECKEKWRNLRTVFMRKMKQPPSGSGAKKKAYYLETAMQFCLPYIKPLAPPSSGNLQPIPPSPTDDNSRDVEITDISNTSDSMDISHSVQFSRESSCNSPDISRSGDSASEQQKTDISVQFSPYTPAKNRFTSKNKSAAANADHCVAEYFKAKTSKIQQSKAEKIDKQESLKMFLLSMLSELEELSDSQIKYFKRRVLTLIDEISTPLHNQYQMSTLPPMLSPQSDSTYFPKTPQETQISDVTSHETQMSDITPHETQMSRTSHVATDFYNSFSQSLQNSEK